MENAVIRVSYFAGLRDQAGVSEETCELPSCSALEVYQYLAKKYDFDVAPRFIQFALNSEFVSRETLVQSGDHLVFVPPVSGG